MKNNQISLLIHTPDSFNSHELTYKTDRFHTDIIKRRLKQTNFSADEKCIVLYKISDALKSKENNGFIK